VWECIIIFVRFRGKIHAGEWGYEGVGSCEIQQVARCSFPLPQNLMKACMCVCVCVKCIYRKSCHCQCSLTACWSWSHTSCLRLSGQFTSLLLTKGWLHGRHSELSSASVETRKCYFYLRAKWLLKVSIILIHMTVRWLKFVKHFSAGNCTCIFQLSLV